MLMLLHGYALVGGPDIAGAGRACIDITVCILQLFKILGHNQAPQEAVAPLNTCHCRPGVHSKGIAVWPRQIETDRCSQLSTVLPQPGTPVAHRHELRCSTAPLPVGDQLFEVVGEDLASQVQAAHPIVENVAIEHRDGVRS